MEVVRTFFIQNFGCRATQADGAALEGLLGHSGLDSSPDHRKADLVILNTCSVTSSADEDVRRSIHKIHRENPEAQILVTGCYAQRAPEEIERIPGVTWIVGNSHKTEIPSLIGSLEGPTPYHGSILVGDISEATEFLSAPVEHPAGDRTRPNLKIQEGCNNRCSFCIIPSLRGPSRSMTSEEAVAQVGHLAERYREIVLTGINLGRWGRERGFGAGPGMRLSHLLRRLLNETAIERLRLSSVEPMDFSDDLLELMAAEPRIARHVHAPLQSGSDTVLRRMKRRYRTRHYEDRLLKAYSLLPEAAFGADVMTGFPGETDDEFQATIDFIERLPFTYLHVFTYSERPGTPAAAAPDRVPHAVRRERTRLLRDLAARKNLHFRRRMVGKVLSAVTLQNGAAMTTNYLKVDMTLPRPANRMIELKLGGLTADGLAEASPLRVLAS